MPYEQPKINHKTTMKAIIDFSEIRSLVKSKTGREVVLSAISERTVRAEAKMSVKVPFIGKIEKTLGWRLPWSG